LIILLTWHQQINIVSIVFFGIHPDCEFQIFGTFYLAKLTGFGLILAAIGLGLSGLDYITAFCLHCVYHASISGYIAELGTSTAAFSAVSAATLEASTSTHSAVSETTEVAAPAPTESPITGAVVGIVVGVAAAAALLAVIIYAITHHSKNCFRRIETKRFFSAMVKLHVRALHRLKGNCSEKFLLQNIFGFHVYITNIYVKISTETVIMQKKQL